MYVGNSPVRQRIFADINQDGVNISGVNSHEAVTAAIE
jgi:hypothetical protein